MSDMVVIVVAMTIYFVATQITNAWNYHKIHAALEKLTDRNPQ